MPRMVYDEPTVRMNVLMPQKTRDRLERIARKEVRSMSQYISMLIERHADWYEGQEEQAKKKAK